MKEQLIEKLSELISESRRKKFDEVLNYRTQHLTIVLEDIFQPHNASAVLRSCDIFGVQDVHIIENRNTYTVNPDIALGASKWLTIKKYNQQEHNTETCLTTLKQKGYKIVATSLHETSCSIEELPVDTPIALVFGTELTGISEAVKQHADKFVKIPMFGFTESFNISVSAALCLNTLIHKIHHSPLPWQLSEEEKNDLLLQWLKKTIKKGEMIEQEIIKKLSK